MDDDEDGIFFPMPDQLYPGALCPIAIDLTYSPFDGYVDGWIDFNHDGDWDDQNEHVLDNHLAHGVYYSDLHTINIPSDAVPGDTYARFRISSVDGLSYDGAAPDGEVEDYRITIIPASSENLGVSIDNHYQCTYYTIEGSVWDDTYGISFVTINVSYEDGGTVYYWDGSFWDNFESTHTITSWLSGGGTSSNPYLWNFAEIPSLIDGEEYTIQVKVTNSIGQTSTDTEVFTYTEAS